MPEILILDGGDGPDVIHREGCRDVIASEVERARKMSPATFHDLAVALYGPEADEELGPNAGWAWDRYCDQLLYSRTRILPCVKFPKKKPLPKTIVVSMRVKIILTAEGAESLANEYGFGDYDGPSLESVREHIRESIKGALQGINEADVSEWIVDLT